MPPAHPRTIWCRSTFGPRSPGLSNPTSFLRPALPMAPTTDNNARDERSVLRPNRNFSRAPYLQILAQFGARRSVMMILNLSESLAKPHVMAKLNMAYLSSLKNRAKTAVVLIAGVTISGTPCPRHITVPFGAEAPSGHVAQA